MTLYQKLSWLLRMGVDETVGADATNRLIPIQKSAQIPTATPLFSAGADNTLQQAILLATGAKTLSDLQAALTAFDGCTLKKTAATTVFAKGKRPARVMCIGEMPEAEDDKQGQPFTGETGELLNKMLAAIGLSTETDTYISMLIPWRAPGNRKPTGAELSICLPFIKRHIELVNPDILVLFGGLTSGALLGIDSISKARGAWHDYTSDSLTSPIPCLVTFSPAFLMKNPTHKKQAWEDLQRLKKRLGESI